MVDNLTGQSSRLNSLTYPLELGLAHHAEGHPHHHLLKTAAREIVSNVVILTLVPALHPTLGRILALPCPSEVIAEVGKDPLMVAATLIAVGPTDDVEVDQDAMCTVLSGPLEVVLALGPCPDVRAIDLALGAGPLVIPGEVMVRVTFVENLGRTATVCVPVVLDHHHTPGLGLALVPCRTRPIPDLAGAEVVLGQSVGGEGVTVVMILGIAGQGLHANHDFQLLYYKHVLRYSWYTVSVISQNKSKNRPLEISIFPSIIGRIDIVVSKEWAGIEVSEVCNGNNRDIRVFIVIPDSIGHPFLICLLLSKSWPSCNTEYHRQ
jgi:hypothetical protein